MAFAYPDGDCVDPLLTGEDLQVARGGSYSNPAHVCRSACRIGFQGGEPKAIARPAQSPGTLCGLAQKIVVLVAIAGVGWSITSTINDLGIGRLKK